MIKEARKTLLIKLLPQEKTWDKEDLTVHDKLIILGWNTYRDELLKQLRLK